MDGQDVILDCHSRAFCALELGWERIPVIYDDADDWPYYDVCVLACQERGISSVLDLKEAIVNLKTYQNDWIGFCQQLSQGKTESRSNTAETDLEKS